MNVTQSKEGRKGVARVRSGQTSCMAVLAQFDTLRPKETAFY